MSSCHSRISFSVCKYCGPYADASSIHYMDMAAADASFLFTTLRGLGPATGGSRGFDPELAIEQKSRHVLLDNVSKSIFAFQRKMHYRCRGVANHENGNAIAGAKQKKMASPPRVRI